MRRRRGARAALVAALLLGNLAGLATSFAPTPPSSARNKAPPSPPLTTCAATAPTFSPSDLPTSHGKGKETGGVDQQPPPQHKRPAPTGDHSNPPQQYQHKKPQHSNGPREGGGGGSRPPTQQYHSSSASEGGGGNRPPSQQQQQQNHIPSLPYTRLQGSDVETLLNSIELHAAEAKIEELTDALSRLARLAPSHAYLGRIARDARFILLLDFLTDGSHVMPSKWAPFVLSSLTKFTAADAGSKLLSSPAMTSLLQVLQQRVDAGLDQLSPIGLCTVAFSYSRLRYVPHLEEVAEGQDAVAAWWARFIETTKDSLIEFSPWELSQLVRSLMAQAEVPKETLLTPSFLTLALKCAERQFHTTFTARDLEGLATSLSKLPSYLYKPDPRFLENLVKAGDAHLPTFRPPMLARFLHALSRFEGFVPDTAFLQRSEQACWASAGKWDQGSIALVSQAWSWMRYQPSEGTLNALLAQARGMLVDHSFTPLNIGTLIQSLGELRRCPDEAWLCDFRETAYQKLDEMQGKDLNFVLKGLAKLNWFPGDAFVAALLQRMTAHINGFNGADLQFTVSSLVGLHFQPSREFVLAFQARISALLRQNQVSPRDLSIILWSFAALEIPDSRAFSLELMTAAVAQLQAERPRWSSPDFTPNERWTLTARVRQLRQVYMYAESQKQGGEQGSLAEDFRRLGLLNLVEEGLAHVSDEMVLAKAQESGFHREVAEVLQSLGATTRRSVDCFVLDLLIESPQAARAQAEEEGELVDTQVSSAAHQPKEQKEKDKPLVLLLHGPSRFLRGQTGATSPKLEAGTAFKEKILQTQSPHRFTRVASLDVWEWAKQKTKQAKIELLRAKIGRGLLESYLRKQKPPGAGVVA